MHVSFIIRAYNAEATIRRAIESARLQDVSPDAYEIVLIDDGSTDETASIAEAMSEPRLRLISQANKGLIGASNAGIRAARGNIVMFLDADDEILSGALSVVLRTMEDAQTDYAYGDYIEEYKGAEKRIIPDHPFKAPMGAFAWRRESILGVGGFRGGTIFPEYELLLRAWGAWRETRIHTPLFIYHRSPDSMTGDPSRIANSIQALRTMYPTLGKEISRIRSYDLSSDT